MKISIMMNVWSFFSVGFHRVLKLIFVVFHVFSASVFKSCSVLFGFFSVFSHVFSVGVLFICGGWFCMHAFFSFVIHR